MSSSVKSLALAVVLLLSGNLAAGDAGSLLRTITSVGKEGVGNGAAASAWKTLVQQGPAVLLEALAAMDDAGPAATNWLRSAVEVIADRATLAGLQAQRPALESFIADTRHAGRSRRLAYETLLRIEPEAAYRLLPKMLDDPGQELRRDAVAVLLADAQKLFDQNDPKARTAYRQALTHARDRDQVTLVAERLKKLGAEIDLTKHHGFLTRWQLVGPFDNRGGAGFAAVYPPEKGVDLKASYPGQDHKMVRWQEQTTAEKMGIVDFNKIYGPLHGTVAYGYTVVLSPREQSVELRAGSNNAVRMYLNGREVYFREEYHHGMQMDQHIGRGTLKAGRNEVLIKVCQNEQTDAWAQLWSFQLRVTDALGAAVVLETP